MVKHYNSFKRNILTRYNEFTRITRSLQVLYNLNKLFYCQIYGILLFMTVEPSDSKKHKKQHKHYNRLFYTFSCLLLYGINYLDTTKVSQHSLFYNLLDALSCCSFYIRRRWSPLGTINGALSL